MHAVHRVQAVRLRVRVRARARLGLGSGLGIGLAHLVQAVRQPILRLYLLWLHLLAIPTPLTLTPPPCAGSAAAYT